MKLALTSIVVLALAAVSGCTDSARPDAGSASAADSQPKNSFEKKAPPVDDPDYLLNFTAESITGDPVDLNRYRGKVVLVVNTASKCGLTPQYEQLQELYEQHKGEGLVVLGFPSNDFHQETGSNDDIADFCDARYGVSFPMFAKVRVKGEDPHPLFAQLHTRSQEPTWNFTKYLIDRDGHFVTRFDHRTTPTSEEVVTKVTELLQQPAAG
ncbi:MAG: glutathione peroxidase [Phycisphaerales bacterium JB065]